MMDLSIISRMFPTVGAASIPPAVCSPLLCQVTSRILNAGCSALPTEDASQCSCPIRTVVPDLPKDLPFECIPENNERMEKWLLQYFASSTFNTCPHCPLPHMTGPPAEIHLKDDAIPKAVTTPATVPIHWQKQVEADILRDEALGVLEKVPYGEPVTWCHRMVVQQKHDGTPCRTVDDYCKRETFANESPFHLARRIPPNTWKTVSDAWNGYHIVPDRHLTTFITPSGRYHYRTLPRGFKGSGDAYNQRFNTILTDMEHKERIVDDTIHSDSDLKEHWWCTIKYLSCIGQSGIILNPDKFFFA